MRKKDFLKALVAAGALCVALDSCVAVEAAPVSTPLDAGTIGATLDQEREWKPKEDAPEIEVNLGKVTGAQDETRITLKGLEFHCDDKSIDADAMREFGKSYMGKDVNISELQEMAATLTQKLHDDGYMTAIAYLPPQEITDGIVAVEVLVGHYGDTTYDNTSELVTSRADGFTYPTRRDKVIERSKLDKLLYILNDIPGVRAHAFLYPGEDEGHASIRYQLTTTETDGGYAYVDNYGSRFTGNWRWGASYYWNNLSHVGDQLQLSYLQSFGRGVYNYDIQYQLPVGNRGTFAGIEIYRTDYHLGREYYSLDATGESSGVRLFTRTSMKRTLNNNSFFLAEIDYSKLSDRVGDFDTDDQKHNLAFRFGYDGDYRNKHMAATYKLMHSIGHLSMDTDYASTYDSHNTAGTWQKTTLNVYDIHYLAPRLELHTTLRGQYAWKNLNSSEKMFISGYGGVRAFPQGESGGDHGVFVSTELRYQMDPHWTLAGYYDGGWVEYNRKALAGETNKTKSLQGVGLGLIWRGNGGSYARLDYAVPVGHRYSNAEGANVDGRLWFRFIQKI